jgi:hypothetical protein
MGGRCIEHDQVPSRVFVRGRPLMAVQRNTRVGYAPRTFATSGAASTLDARSDTSLDLAPSRS